MPYRLTVPDRRAGATTAAGARPARRMEILAIRIPCQSNEACVNLSDGEYILILKDGASAVYYSV
jgi:hypothetical protein